MVGCYLNLSEQDLTAVDRDNHMETWRKLAMLDSWHERDRCEGSNATYLRLADALQRHGRRDLVELLCEIVKKPTWKLTNFMTLCNHVHVLCT